MGPVPGTSTLKSLQEGTGGRDLSHEQLHETFFEELVSREDLCQKF